MLLINNCFNIECTQFSQISSDGQGTVAHWENPSALVLVRCCEFDRIESSKWPGCIYLNGSSYQMNHCSFVRCSAHGGDKSNGNAICIKKSIINIESNQFFLTAPTTLNTGDSLVSFYYSESDVKLLNSTSCNGVEGASSVSCWEPSINQTIYKYFNIVNCADWCALEITITDQAELHFFNFIDTTKVTNHTINNDRTKQLNIYDSIFIQNTERDFCYDLDSVFLHNCYNDGTLQGISSSIDQSVTKLPFTIDVKYNKCVINKTHAQTIQFFISPLFTIIFILFPS